MDAVQNGFDLVEQDLQGGTQFVRKIDNKLLPEFFLIQQRRSKRIDGVGNFVHFRHTALDDDPALQMTSGYFLGCGRYIAHGPGKPVKEQDGHQSAAKAYADNGKNNERNAAASKGVRLR